MLSRIIADKIASVTKNVPLTREVRVSPDIVSKEGYIVAGRIRGEKSVYNTIENCSGRMVKLHKGDVLIGALGHRNALHGYSGVVPDSVYQGDILHVLNLGGVIGHCTSVNAEVGQPFEFEVLGSVQVFPEFGSRTGVSAHTSMNALLPKVALVDAPRVPIVFIAGTCMNAGKTLAASQITRQLTSAGKRVAGAKLTGVSLLKDTLSMKDYGAEWAASFMDMGVVATSPETAVGSAQGILSYLSTSGAEVIVAELGDGIMGLYGVQEILQDSEIASRSACFVLCANDPVGAWGSVKLLMEEYRIQVDVITGPTTDNMAGISSIAAKTGIAAINARKDGYKLSELVFDKVWNQGSEYYLTGNS